MRRFILLVVSLCGWGALHANDCLRQFTTVAEFSTAVDFGRDLIAFRKAYQDLWYLKLPIGERVIDRVVTAVEKSLPALLDAHGVRYSRKKLKAGTRLTITPRDDNPLGRLAKGLARSGFLLTFAPPRQMLTEGFLGKFSAHEKRLYLSLEAGVDVDQATHQIHSVLRPSGTDLHETWHFGEYRRAKLGVRTPYQGGLYAIDGPMKRFEHYSGALSFEEALAYSVDHYQRARSLRRLAQRAADPTLTIGARDLAELNREFAAWKKEGYLPNERTVQIVAGLRDFSSGFPRRK